MSQLEHLIDELAAKARERGVRLLRDRGGDWLEKGLRWAESYVEKGLPLNGAGGREELEGVFSRLREGKPALLGVAEDRFADALAFVWHGHLDLAEDRIRGLSYEERRELFRMNNAQAYRLGELREQRWEAFTGWVKDVGAELLKAGIPILLAALRDMLADD